MKNPSNKRFIDLTGMRFGMLTVKSFLGKRKWECVCDCGSSAAVFASSLKSGHTKSCGCFRKQVTGARSRTHGLSKTAEYRVWKDIKRRCIDKNNKEYHNYGGRGITVCDRWLNSFECFLQDMGLRPTNKHSIERIDVNSHYEPKNCKWATSSEQARNRRNNRIIIFNGEKMILKDAAEKYGIHFTTIIHRLDDCGWSVEKALTTKPKN